MKSFSLIHTGIAALELEIGLIVESDKIQVSEPYPPFFEDIPRRSRWEDTGMLFSCEPLLMGCRYDLTIDQERGGTIMIISRNTQDCVRHVHSSKRAYK